MDEHTTRDLLARIKGLESKPDVRRGVVTAVAPLAVTLGGASTPYTSVETVDDGPLLVGDFVSALVYGNALIVLGRVSAPSLIHTIGGAGEPAFTNGWINYGAGEQVVQFWRIGTRVYLRGIVKSGTIALAMFTLPASYRPPAAVRFAVASNSAFGEVDVYATGAVFLTVGSALWVDLAPISFDTRA